MKPRAQQDSKCPDAECDIKQGDESIVNMAIYNGSRLPTWFHKAEIGPTLSKISRACCWRAI
eukprot:1847139-Amphidinium_carterae.1